MLAKSVNRVMLANEDAKSRFSDKAHFVLTGNPIRPAILSTKHDEAKAKLGLDDSKPIILSFGGSLGAECINRSMAELIARSAKDKKYHHIHAYGQQGTWMPDLLKSMGVDPKDYDNLDIRQYIDNMDECLAACDLVVSRAGAITLSEVQAKGRPAVLIPSPFVAENHQYHNAMALAENGAAFVIEQKDLTPDALSAYVEKLIREPDVFRATGRAARNMAITDAQKKICDIILRLYKDER